MKNIVYCAMSLDGFIAEKDGGVEFLDSAGAPPDGEDYGWSAFFGPIDALVMGRNTYDVLIGFGGEWPYGDKKIVVLTTRDIEIADAVKDRVSTFSGAPDEVMAHLKLMNCQTLYIDGGKVVQDFLRAGLIDEMILTVVPILLGEGIELFSDLPEYIHLDAVSTRRIDNGLIQLHYQLKK